MRLHELHVHIGRLVIDAALVPDAGLPADTFRAALQAALAAQAGWAERPAQGGDTGVRAGGPQQLASLVAGSVVHRLGPALTNRNGGKRGAL